MPLSFSPQDLPGAPSFAVSSQRVGYSRNARTALRFLIPSPSSMEFRRSQKRQQNQNRHLNRNYSGPIVSSRAERPRILLLTFPSPLPVPSLLFLPFELSVGLQPHEKAPPKEGLQKVLKNSVLFKGTASAMPETLRSKRGFSRRGTFLISRDTFHQPRAFAQTLDTAATIKSGRNPSPAEAGLSTLAP